MSKKINDWLERQEKIKNDIPEINQTKLKMLECALDILFAEIGEYDFERCSRLERMIQEMRDELVFYRKS